MFSSRKILSSIAVIGTFYTLLKLFEGGTGGGAFENAFTGILYTIVALFSVSLIYVVLKIKYIKKRPEELYVFAITAIFLLIVLIDKLHN